MPVDLATFFGYAATFFAISFMMPQLYRMYSTKSVEDISWAMLVLFFFNCASWVAYGVLLPSQPVFVANTIGLVIVSLQLVLKYLYRNNP